MSDSYVVGRAGAGVKRRKPPKQPRRAAYHPLPWVMVLAGDLLYYIAATEARYILLVGLYGMSSLIALDQLVLWWRWRNWSRWTRWSIQRVEGLARWLPWAIAIFIWVRIVQKVLL